jgi:hypothetical protein
MTTIRLFVDTNLFLQCRDIKDLPWKEISGDGNLELIVPRAVQEEIDRLKSDGNSRRAKRARTANSYLREIALSEGERLVVCESKPRVEITVSPSLSLVGDPTGKVFLDASRSDDAIIMELIAYRQAYPDLAAGLLTHDTVPLLTVKRLKLPSCPIPDEWLLPPEPSAEERKIKELQAQIAVYEGTLPKIEFTPSAGGTLKEISGQIIQYPPLSDEDIEGIMVDIKRTFPLVDPNSHSPSVFDRISRQMNTFQEYVPPTDEEIEKYRETDYPNWLAIVESKVRSMAGHLSTECAKLQFEFSITNIGNVPAENVLIRIEVSEGMCLLPPDKGDNDKKEDAEWSYFPPPPEVPTGHYRSRLTYMSALNDLARQLSVSRVPINHDILNFKRPAHDPERFYWRPERPSLPIRQWELKCDTFRHKGDAKEFSLELAILEKGPSGGVFKCTVAAQNLRNNAELSIPPLCQTTCRVPFLN